MSTLQLDLDKEKEETQLSPLSLPPLSLSSLSHFLTPPFPPPSVKLFIESVTSGVSKQEREKKRGME